MIRKKGPLKSCFWALSLSKVELDMRRLIKWSRKIAIRKLSKKLGSWIRPC